MDINITDTIVDFPFSQKMRGKVLENKLNEFKKAKLVLTDRLHGMIFAAITGTPCVAMDNYNHKVRGVYQLMKHIEYIEYVYNIHEIPSSIQRLLSLKECVFNTNYFKSDFENLARIIQEERGYEK